MRQSDGWLLIYGREKAKLLVAASKTALLLFSSNVKIKKVFKERVLSSIVSVESTLLSKGRFCNTIASVALVLSRGFCLFDSGAEE